MTATTTFRDHTARPTTTGFIVRMQSTPNQNGGLGYASPQLSIFGDPTGFTPLVVAADHPEPSPVYDDTGWYSLFWREYDSLDAAVKDLASQIWDSQSGRDWHPDLPRETEERMARQYLAELGYPVA